MAHEEWTPVLKKQLLDYVQQFAPVQAQELEQLLALCGLRRVTRGQVLVQEGEVDNYLNLVIEGLVRKLVRTGNSEVTLQLATEGHIIQSEISFLTRKPSPVIIEALEPSLLLSLHYDNAEKAYRELPFAEKMGRDLITTMFIKKDSRYYKQMGMSTRERFLEYMQEHPHMLQRVPQKILASYLNIKPETFSRLKHLLRKK